ncbi:MAG: CvpA family protein [Planctomycetota bacterium]|nr:MAG: CvpA family protein [Planctomycetota bacterium]
MQAYDLLMLIVLATATILGAIKGFAWQVASLASVVVSYIVAYRYRMQVAEYIDADPPWNQFLAMLVLYVGTSFVIWVGFRMISGLIDRVRLKEFDRHLGAVFGFFKGLVYCLLITMFAVSLLGPKQQEAICQSRSGYYISLALDRSAGIMPREIHDVVGPYLAKLDEKLDHRNHQHDATGGVIEPDGSQTPWWQPGLLEGLTGSEAVPEELQQSLRNIPMPDTLLPDGSNPAQPQPPPTQPGFGSGPQPILPPTWGNTSSHGAPAAGEIAPPESPSGGQLRPAGSRSASPGWPYSPR